MHRKPKSSSSHSCRPRSLCVESLEQRDLLSVSVINNGGETFKSFLFTGTESIAGSYTYLYKGQKIAIPYQGTGTISGQAMYSPTQSTATTSASQYSITTDVAGGGTWNAFNVEKGMLQLEGGQVDGSAGNTGKFSGTGSGTIALSGAIDDSFAIQSGLFTGTFNGPQRSISVKYSQNGLVLNMSGSFVPQAADGNPFGVTATPGTLVPKPKAAGSSLQVSVAVQGPVAKTTSYTTPAAYIDLYWGNSKGKAIGAVLGKVSIDWNEATGSYTFTNLPIPPRQPINSYCSPKLAANRPLQVQWR